MSLLSIISDPEEGAAVLCGLPSPSVIIGSTDPNVPTLLRLANQEGRELARRHDWQALLVDYTVDTVAAELQTSLPADYERLTPYPELWNRSISQMYCGPTSPRDWGRIKALQTTSVPDTNDSYTKIFLKFDGTDASTTITDTNAGGFAHTWTANGNAQIDTAQSRFGGASLLCDGTGDYVTTTDNADFTLGSGDFTIDTWVNVAGGSGGVRAICGQADSSATGSTRTADIVLLNTNVFAGNVGIGSTVTTVTGTTTITSSGWHHVALTRSGNTLRLFVDGIQEGGNTNISGSINDSSNAYSVGRLGEFTTLTWNGWIDNFRLSVGIARWTANFTPPGVTIGSSNHWRLLGDDLYITPPPTAGQTLAFPYMSKNWVRPVSGSDKAAFTLDTDTALIPERLITLGIIWRYKASKGFDYAEAMATYEREVERAASRDAGTGVLYPSRSRTTDETNTTWQGTIIA